MCFMVLRAEFLLPIASCGSVILSASMLKLIGMHVSVHAACLNTYCLPIHNDCYAHA